VVQGGERFAQDSMQFNTPEKETEKHRQSPNPKPSYHTFKENDPQHCRLSRYQIVQNPLAFFNQQLNRKRPETI